MHHRVILAGLAATGGLLTTALLQAAVAVADTADVVSATGADAFTIGSYTFDPFTVPLLPGGQPGAIDILAPTGVETEGFSAVDPFSSAPPLLPGDMAAVVWIAFDLLSSRFRMALTIPLETVASSAKGLPIAITASPTCTFSESPSGKNGKSRPEAFSTAISLFSSTARTPSRP